MNVFSGVAFSFLIGKDATQSIHVMQKCIRTFIIHVHIYEILSEIRSTEKTCMHLPFVKYIYLLKNSLPVSC